MPVTRPSALNVLIIGISMIIFTFIWRQVSARLAENDSAFGGAMAAIF